MILLHLVQTPLRLRSFTEWALERRFLRVPPGDGQGRPREPDLGYALHAALMGLFGEKAPRPFTLPPVDSVRLRTPLGGSGDAVPVLGYSGAGRESLMALAELANQEFRDLFVCGGLRTRAIPTSFPQGLRLGFDLRACPVRRRKPGLPFMTNTQSALRGSVSYSGGGYEVDAFQLASIRAEQRQEPIPRRDEVYADWLAERFTGTSGQRCPVSLVEGSVHVRSYRSTRLLRRPRNGNRRSSHWLTRPEVWFSGKLEVVDGAAIPEFLGRGIGRHSGFGFGMLLLQPA